MQTLSSLLICAVVLTIICALFGKIILFCIGLGIIAALIAFLYRPEYFVHGYADPHLAALQTKISEVIPEMSTVRVLGGPKSETYNKHHIFICLKDEKGQYYSDNMLVYVLLHELAHALTPELRHTKLWHQNFQDLLRRAEKGGLYDPSIPVVADYCKYGGTVQ